MINGIYIPVLVFIGREEASDHSPMSFVSVKKELNSLWKLYTETSILLDKNGTFVNMLDKNLENLLRFDHLTT